MNKKHIFTWQHKNTVNKIVGEIKRFIDESENKKDIPFYIPNISGGFDRGTTDEMKSKGNPLFGLETFTDKNKRLIIVEGQKAAAACQTLGLQCVTSILGASNATKSNWQVLDGATEMYFLPDNDESGEKYIRDVAEIFSCFPNSPTMQIIRLPNLPVKGDVCDWLKQQPELKDWNELDSLENHHAKEIIHNRLNQVINDNLQPIPSDWTEWVEPEEIESSSLLPVKALLPESLPEPYKEYINDIAYRMQCPIDFVAISSIITIATVVGAGCGIRPKQFDDWLVIPNLWGAAIGRPAILKTPSINEPLKVLSGLEIEANKEFDKAKIKYESRMIAYKVKLNSAEDSIRVAANSENQEGMEDAENEYEQVKCEEPKKPIKRRFKSNDSTIEKTGELLAENPRGLLLYRDELTGLLLTWDKSGHETDRAFYLEAWDGKNSFTTDRIGRGTIEIENVCISLIGTIQPDKLMVYLYQASCGQNDGFIQRLQLAVYPDEPIWELIDKLPNLQAKEKVFEIIKTLVSMDFVKHGAILQEGGRIPYFHFYPEAQLLFNGWFASLEQKIRSEARPVMQEHLAKYRSLMPSLALLFHLVAVASGNYAGEIGVSHEAAEKAIAWCDYLESHARRIYGLCTTFEQQAVIELAKKIKKGKLQNSFTVRDVYRNRWHMLTDKVLVQSACDELVEANWLRKQITEAAFGQKPKATYFISPKVKKIN